MNETLEATARLLRAIAGGSAFVAADSAEAGRDAATARRVGRALAAPTGRGRAGGTLDGCVAAFLTGTTVGEMELLPPAEAAETAEAWRAARRRPHGEPATATLLAESRIEAARDRVAHALRVALARGDDEDARDRAAALDGCRLTGTQRALADRALGRSAPLGAWLRRHHGRAGASDRREDKTGGNAR